jgi:hypothetical protein
MRRIVALKRILGLLVLGLSLHAVCPATDYNSRLELFNPTAAPADVQRSKPVAPMSWVRSRYTGWSSSELRASLSRAQFRREQIVHAAIPIYQKELPAADDSQIVETRTAASLYSSCLVPRASGRGPPRLSV